IPTGMTPSANGTSWLAHATVATRSGRSSIVVVPSACSITTGKFAEDPAAAVLPDWAAAEAPRADIASAAVAELANGTRPRDRIGQLSHSQQIGHDPHTPGRC